MQGWRSNMEDAHLAISDFFFLSRAEGDEVGGSRVGFFAVFDGHGGHEVAEFCRLHMSEELQRQLDKRREDAGMREGAFALFGEALRGAFHSMDDLLRQADGERELAAIKQGVSPNSSSSSAAGHAARCVLPSSRREAQVASFLRASIEGDLAQVRARGGRPTDDERAEAMMKMSLLRRLESLGTAAPGRAADGVGCTAVCILITDTEVVCANAGDSRAVLCRGGKAIDLSKDHKPNDELERRRIETAGGRIEETSVGDRVMYRVNGNLNLSRSIGDLAFKKRPELGPEHQVISATPDVVHMQLREDDEFVVLACDGVWDVKTSQEACDFVRARLEAGQAAFNVAEALLDECLAADAREAHGIGTDNMTCVVVRCVPGA